MASAVSALGPHFSSASRAAVTASTAASPSPSSRARRAVRTCRHAPQRGSAAAARAASTSSRVARNAVASSRSLAVSRRHSAASRSLSVTPAGPGVTLSSARRDFSARFAHRPGGRQPSPGGARAPPRPHYPRRVPGMPLSTPSMRFAYLGPEGTFAEAALSRAVPASEGRRHPQPSVPAALSAVRSGDADAALVPLENSVEGSVPATMDGLADGDPLVVVREVFLPVTMTLAGRPGVGLADVRSVASHPHALAQSSRWLAANLPGVAPLPTTSTATAAAAVAAGEFDAAVCAPIAAERYGLATLVEDIADHPGAVTRFVLVTRPGPPPERTGNDKTSLVAVVGDRTGALLELLGEFAVRGISLTRIESRPTRERLGVYSFSLDCEGHIADSRVGEALAALHRVCEDVRFLGSYPRADGRDNKPVPPVAGDEAFTEAGAWLGRGRGGSPR